MTPLSTSELMTDHISWRPRGSRPVVGSSRKSTFGRTINVAARSRRRLIPPEYVLIGRLAASLNENCSNNSSARLRAPSAEMRCNRANITKLSQPVRVSSTAAYCPERPITLRTSLGFLITSIPATSARPESGVSSVVRTRTVVVFPAPLGPKSPRTVPSSTSSERPSSART